MEPGHHKNSGCFIQQSADVHQDSPWLSQLVRVSLISLVIFVHLQTETCITVQYFWRNVHQLGYFPSNITYIHVLIFNLPFFHIQMYLVFSVLNHQLSQRFKSPQLSYTQRHIWTSCILMLHIGIIHISVYGTSLDDSVSASNVQYIVHSFYIINVYTFIVHKVAVMEEAHRSPLCKRTVQWSSAHFCKDCTAVNTNVFTLRL